MSKITTSSTAEYFAKNLQQVGFSSPLKAVLTTLKEAVDNSLDACEAAGIAPDIHVEVEKIGPGSSKSSDLIRILVTDNGPGLDQNDLAKVFGEYLASSKFGRGQCSRGQQGIGISAATTWAQLTNAKGVHVVSKTKKMRKAIRGIVDVDIKGNKGVFKPKDAIDWDRPHGVSVEFKIDGRVQLNGDGGLITYLEGTTLLNPHLAISYKLMENELVRIERVTDEVPQIPEPTLPHPHTMKLGEFMTHAGLYGKMTLGKFLKSAFSRVNEGSLKEMTKRGIPNSHYNKAISSLTDQQIKQVFQALQDTPLMAPSTKSVLTVGEEALSKSILRLGEVDFFAVNTRKPRICDFKPVVVEVALARFINRGDNDSPVQLLRFANRVPLQFDKSACAVTRAIESINWRSYGLQQPKGSVPVGPYVFAVSVVSPFIKFKNASKETIDASDELVDEIRRAAMQAGQKLARHIRKEHKEADLERKLQHIESFGPILVEGLSRICKASDARKKRAEEGLKKLLGRDQQTAVDELERAEDRLKKQLENEAYVPPEQLATFGRADEIHEHIEEATGAELKTVHSTKKQGGGKSATTKKKGRAAAGSSASTVNVAAKKKTPSKTTTKKTASASHGTTKKVATKKAGTKKAAAK